MSNDLWISLAVSTFAVYRISRMLAIEEGPFDLFTKLRGLFWHTNIAWVQSGISCPVCISFWIALPVAVIMYFTLHLELSAILWLWLALSGAATFLYRVSE